MKFKQYSLESIMEMEKRYRANFINSLSGFKSVNLCGTISESGVTNLSVISSVVHVGAHPPLMGMIIRPDTVPRHTLSNLTASNYFTLNHIREDFYTKAHQTSARYPEVSSEFEETGLTEWFSENVPAPYVQESHLKIGLKFRERLDITANQTIFIIGEIQEVILPETCIEQDGFVDIQQAGSISCAGLDGYYKAERIARLSYAKPGKEVEIIAASRRAEG